MSNSRKMTLSRFRFLAAPFFVTIGILSLPFLFIDRDINGIFLLSYIAGIIIVSFAVTALLYSKLNQHYDKKIEPKREAVKSMSVRSRLLIVVTSSVLLLGLAVLVAYLTK